MSSISEFLSYYFHVETFRTLNPERSSSLCNCRQSDSCCQLLIQLQLVDVVFTTLAQLPGTLCRRIMSTSLFNFRKLLKTLRVFCWKKELKGLEISITNITTLATICLHRFSYIPLTQLMLVSCAVVIFHFNCFCFCFATLRWIKLYIYCCFIDTYTWYVTTWTLFS